MWLALPAAYLPVALLFHAITARVRPAGNRVQQFLLCGSLTGLALIWHVTMQPDLSLPARVAAILLYAFGCELYIFLFTFVTSSVSVALLVSPDASRPGSKPADMVQRRLATMHAAGLLQESAGRYHLAPRARRLVRFYRALRTFFQHRDNP